MAYNGFLIFRKLLFLLYYKEETEAVILIEEMYIDGKWERGVPKEVGKYDGE